jgi:hypothetical protein
MDVDSTIGDGIRGGSLQFSGEKLSGRYQIHIKLHKFHISKYLLIDSDNGKIYNLLERSI